MGEADGSSFKKRQKKAKACAQQYKARLRNLIIRKERPLRPQGTLQIEDPATGKLLLPYVEAARLHYAQVGDRGERPMSSAAVLAQRLEAYRQHAAALA